jgi:hypothetical protein
MTSPRPLNAHARLVRRLALPGEGVRQGTLLETAPGTLTGDEG